MESLIAWLVADGHGYPLIFAALLISGLGVPLPEDVPLLSAGVLAANGGWGVLPASLACGVFVLLRDSFVFGMGYRYGMGLLDTRWGSRLVKRSAVDIVQDKVRRNGAAVVFIGRFLPGLRGPVFFVAGTTRVHPLLFLAVDGFAALISVPVFVWLGFAFADNLPRVQRVLGDVRFGVWAAVGLITAVLVVRWWRRRGEAEQQA